MNLKNSISMQGHIEKCWLFTHRVPADRVRGLLPQSLELVTYRDWAFFNTVVARMTEMRPKSLPRWLGTSYWHVAYRLYAKFQSQEGLYFLRSDADSSLMVSAGNALTDFHFHRAHVQVHNNLIDVSAVSANLRVTVGDAPDLSAGSPFATLEEAAQFLRYHPAGISVNRDVNLVRIVRNEDDWKYRLRSMYNPHFEYLEKIGAVPEICYEVEPIDYIWLKAERFNI